MLTDYFKQIRGTTIQKKVRRDTNIEYVADVKFTVTFSKKPPKDCKEYDYFVDDEGNVVALEFYRNYIYITFMIIFLKNSCRLE